MAEESVTQADLKVFAEYGRTMLSVQLFELNLAGLVQIGQPELPEDTPFEEGWKRVEPLFRMTAGQLRQELKKQGNIPDDLLDETQTAVNTRNTLAHHYLLEYRMHKIADPEAHKGAVVELTKVRRKFEALNAKLDALTHERAKERGWDLNEVDLTD